MILYAMLYGKYPFDAKEARFARKIVTADYTLLPVCMATILMSSLPYLFACLTQQVEAYLLIDVMGACWTVRKDH